MHRPCFLKKEGRLRRGRVGRLESWNERRGVWPKGRSDKGPCNPLTWEWFLFLGPATPSREGVTGAAVAERQCVFLFPRRKNRKTVENNGPATKVDVHSSTICSPTREPTHECGNAKGMRTRPSRWLIFLPPFFSHLPDSRFER